MKTYSVFFIMLFVLASCQTNAPNTPLNDFNLSVVMPEQNRIRFSGKGAGAGMMMAGSMGPMGIAIGVAIDEGIAKSIQDAAGTAQFNMRELIVSKARTYIHDNTIDLIQLYAQKPQPDKPITFTIDVKKYGFELVKSSDQDMATAFIDATITIGSTILSTNNLTIDESLLSRPLDELKQNGESVVAVFNQAIDQKLNALNTKKLHIEKTGK